MFWSYDWDWTAWWFHLHMYNSSNWWKIALWVSTVWTFPASESINWNSWNHIVLTKEWWTMKVYKNKNLILTTTYNYSIHSNGSWLIWNWYTDDRHVQWVFDEVIIETVVWSQSQINKYYDKIVS